MLLCYNTNLVLNLFTLSPILYYNLYINLKKLGGIQMDILLMIFIFLGLTSVLAMVALFYNNGEYLKSKLILALIILHLYSLSFIAYTGLPSNYIFKKVICAIFIILGSLGCILNFSKKDSSLMSRLMIAVSIVGNIIVLFI